MDSIINKIRVIKKTVLLVLPLLLMNCDKDEETDTSNRFTITEALIDTGLPVVIIETENRTRIFSKEKYVNASMIIKYKGSTLHSNTIQIRGRGNATWFNYPKKPFRIKLDEKADLLGMSAEKDWVMLANYGDKTLMRTAFALELSERMNFPWTPENRFVEVFLNGEFIGNYNLTEHIEQGENRINVPERGYIIERDDYYAEEPVWFRSAVRGYGWSFKNPDTDDIKEQEVEYIRKYVDDFETALASSSFGDPDKGFKRYIDMYSFARWFVFQQILANIDTNFYLLKDGTDDNSKLTMGPVWDFEWTTGIGWYEGDRPRPADYWVLNGNSFYFDRMLQDADFKALVKSVWAEYRSAATDMLNYFEVLRLELYESQKLNFRRWDIMDKRIHVGGIPLGSFDREVDCDKQFFKNRITWLETAFNEL
ncbi:MAG: CotH kinase family protein [Tannerella sp.]|jgi:hypothetical protein|nr:CotH kinase family protein [Tannerella sp.]